jgi:hypothetical protein
MTVTDQIFMTLIPACQSFVKKCILNYMKFWKMVQSLTPNHKYMEGQGHQSGCSCSKQCLNTKGLDDDNKGSYTRDTGNLNSYLPCKQFNIHG